MIKQAKSIYFNQENLPHRILTVRTKVLNYYVVKIWFSWVEHLGIEKYSLPTKKDKYV